MASVYFVFAHPHRTQSRVCSTVLKRIRDLDNVTVCDLYEAYPAFHIPVADEQAKVVANAVILLQHPFYWYSAPAIIKEWQDLVLENGWAYGPGGSRLAGRFLLSAISTGGTEQAYHPQGRHRFEVEDLLAPFNQTTHLCSMAYRTPFVIQAGRRASPEALGASVESYRDLVIGLRDGAIDPLERLAHGYVLPPGFAAKAAA